MNNEEYIINIIARRVSTDFRERAFIVLKELEDILAVNGDLSDLIFKMMFADTLLLYTTFRHVIRPVNIKTIEGVEALCTFAKYDLANIEKLSVVYSQPEIKSDIARGMHFPIKSTIGKYIETKDKTNDPSERAVVIYKNRSISIKDMKDIEVKDIIDAIEYNEIMDRKYTKNMENISFV